MLEGFANGDYNALPNVWEKAFCLISVGHAEGPGHLARMRDDTLARSRALVEAAPEHLRLTYRVVEDQNRLAHDVIARFGRHPHRNAVLGRLSTDAEEKYIATGEFPHVRNIPTEPGGGRGDAGARPAVNREAALYPGRGRGIVTGAAPGGLTCAPRPNAWSKTSRDRSRCCASGWAGETAAHRLEELNAMSEDPGTVGATRRGRRS